jgi:hypothetical protein
MMFDFSARTALTIVSQTKGFIVFRVLVYFGVTLGLILATGTGGGIGWGVGAFGDEEFQASSTAWGAVIGFGGAASVLFFLRDYLLYMVKAAHIALMVEFLEGRAIPKGREQISFGQAIIKERFVSASVLFGLDRLIHGVVGAVTGLVEGLLSILPIPGLDRVMTLVRGFLKVAVGLVDEVILAEIIRRKGDDPFHVARQSLVLYAQNAKPVMKNAAAIALLSWLFGLAVFLLMLAPAALVVWILPGSGTAMTLIVAIVFAWATKVAIVEPFALACLLQVYYHVTDGQSPNPEWQAKLERASSKFKALGEKAAGWAGGRAAQG